MAEPKPHRLTRIVPILVGCIGVVGSSSLTLFGHGNGIENAVTLVFPISWTSADVFAAVADLNVDIVEVGPNGLLAVVVPHEEVGTADLLRSGALFSLGALATKLCVQVLS